MEVTSIGIVLSIVPYQDNDNIIEVFLENNKKLVLFAPGTRKLESKNRQSLIIGNIVELSYFKARLDNKMSRLKSVDSIKTFIPTDEHKYGFIKRITNILKEYEFNKQNDIIFKNYNLFIDALINKKDWHNLYLLLMSNVIFDSNNHFKFNKCAVCELNKVIKSFSLREGGVLCEKHSKPNDVIINKNLLIYLYFLLTNNYEHLQTIKINESDINKVVNIMNEYFREILGLYTKA